MAESAPMPSLDSTNSASVQTVRGQGVAYFDGAENAKAHATKHGGAMSTPTPRREG